MEWLYRDTPNIKLRFFDSYETANDFIKSNNPRPILKYGFDHIVDYEHLFVTGLHFDNMFYHLANVPFSLRWDNFFVQRDLDREKAFFNSFQIKEREYLFLHDTYSNGTAPIKEHLCAPNLPVIKPVEGLTDNIFDYMYLLENAKEIHCVDSAFKNLVDSMPTISCPRFFHKNRSYYHQMREYVSTTKLDWTHVEYFDVSPSPKEWFIHRDA